MTKETDTLLVVRPIAIARHLSAFGVATNRTSSFTATRVADLAEKAGHHPDVLLTYPRVTMSLTTHDAGGLTDKDFALAAEIERVA